MFPSQTLQQEKVAESSARTIAHLSDSRAFSDRALLPQITLAKENRRDRVTFAITAFELVRKSALVKAYAWTHVVDHKIIGIFI